MESVHYRCPSGSLPGLSICSLLDLGPLPMNRPTLEKIAPQWDERTMRFRFEDVLHAFTLS